MGQRKAQRELWVFCARGSVIEETVRRPFTYTVHARIKDMSESLCNANVIPADVRTDMPSCSHQ